MIRICPSFKEKLPSTDFIKNNILSLYPKVPQMKQPQRKKFQIYFTFLKNLKVLPFLFLPHQMRLIQPISFSNPIPQKTHTKNIAHPY